MTRHPPRRLGRTDVTLTTLGVGGGPIGDGRVCRSDEDGVATILAAHATGQQYFDTSPWYGLGLSEHRFGQGLRRLARDAFVLSTKVGRVLSRPEHVEAVTNAKWPASLPFQHRYDYSGEGIRRSFEDSIQRLGMPQIDLLLIHDLDVLVHNDRVVVDRHFRQLVEDGGWDELCRLRSGGFVRAVGAGLNDFSGIDPFFEQLDLDFLLVAYNYTIVRQNVLDTVLNRCADRHMGVIVATPYESGLLATDLENEEAARRWRNDPYFDRARATARVCHAHNVPVKAAAVQFPLAHPAVATVVIGAASADQARENAEMMETEIPEAIWSALKAEGCICEEAPTPGA